MAGWKRGNGSIQVELSNVQSWIEDKSPILDGQNGDPGMIRLFYDDRAKRIQKEEDQNKFINRRFQYVSAISGLVALLKILELLHVIPK